MANTSNLIRRRSGVYVARLVVPERHRRALGRSEFRQSTGTAVLAIAKMVTAQFVAGWRQQLLKLDDGGLDLERLSIGSPELGRAGHLPLAEALRVSGLGIEAVLREAAAGRLDLFCRLAGHGHLADATDVDEELTLFAPPGEPASGPAMAQYVSLEGRLWRLRQPHVVAGELLAVGQAEARVFDQVGNKDFCLVTDDVMRLSADMLEVDLVQLEIVRRDLASRLTDEQLASARRPPPPPTRGAKADKRTSEAVAAYMVDKARACAPDHARRIRAACDLFCELEGDPPIGEVDRDRLRGFFSTTLPAVPARENQIRVKFGTRSVKESMAAKPAGWPGLSVGEQHCRVMWILGLFEWLKNERWIADNPGEGLLKLLGLAAPERERGSRDQDARDAFDDAHLTTIFSASWWREGRGELTKAKTYREYQPLYYWLPLLGLYTGARINELSQLYLDDIRQTAGGVWFIDINQVGDKRLKNSHSERLVPIHPRLIELGFVEWVDILRRSGYNRVFPELEYDDVKGYSKSAVKWFSRYMAQLGFVRDGRLTFHSFRHTFSSYCLNVLEVPEATVAQLTGHQRSQKTLGSTYRKDVVPDTVVSIVAKIAFNIPHIAPFDTSAGIKALADSTRRKASVARGRVALRSA